MAQDDLSPVEVGKMAARAGVKQVVLPHLGIPDTPDAKSKLLSGIRENYTGPVTIGSDFMRIGFGSS